MVQIFRLAFVIIFFKRHYVGFLQQAKKSSLEEDNTKQVEKFNRDLANLKSTFEEQKAELQASQKEKENWNEKVHFVYSSFECANAKVFICMHCMEFVFFTYQMHGAQVFLIFFCFFETELLMSIFTTGNTFQDLL